MNTFVMAALLNAVAFAQTPPLSPPDGMIHWIYPSPLINANVKDWMSPGIIIGFLVFAMILLPLFALVMAFTHYVQTPIINPEKSIPWGTVEETE